LQPELFPSAAPPVRRAPVTADGGLGGIVWRPAVYGRGAVRWLSACAWRADTRRHDLEDFKAAKRMLDEDALAAAAERLVWLLEPLIGAGFADGVTSVPCGHSRRHDCFGRRLAEHVARRLALPFVQVHADRFCPGVSHPKEFRFLPPLARIADPPMELRGARVLLIDDIATSGWHLEESLGALRAYGAAALAAVWISGQIK
jgi:hypothetical protein